MAEIAVKTDSLMNFIPDAVDETMVMVAEEEVVLDLFGLQCRVYCVLLCVPFLCCCTIRSSNNLFDVCLEEKRFLRRDFCLDLLGLSLSIFVRLGSLK